MKIQKKKNKIIVEIPFFSKRYNPYMPDDELAGDYPTLTGLIIRHKKDGNNFDEIGFAQTIDRDYKDKCDDVGGFLIMWHRGEKDFKKKCNELGLNIYEIAD